MGATIRDNTVSVTPQNALKYFQKCEKLKITTTNNPCTILQNLGTHSVQTTRFEFLSKVVSHWVVEMNSQVGMAILAKLKCKKICEVNHIVM